MKLQTSTWIIIGLTAVLIIGIPVFYFSFEQQGPGKYDAFAQCITDSQAKFYGAFWCPHCQAQKRSFGTSAKLLPYIECSMPDQKTLTPVCKDADIKSFPTWEFAGGERLEGEIPLATLAEKTNCTLPQ